MRRFILGIAIFWVAVIAILGAGPVRAAAPSIEEALADKVIGRADAPVTIIEFASLTCQFCARFHNDILPRLKAEFIDPGKVRLIYRDFPLDPLAQVAAMMARCAEPTRYFSFLEALYQSQPNWSEAADPLATLAMIGRLGGMSQQDFDSCLQNQELLEGINAGKDKAMVEFGIERTPTFIINGERYVGLMPFEDFEEILKPLLARP